MEELMILLQPIMGYLSPLLTWSVGLVIAVMAGIKAWDKENKAKKFYWLIGLGLSALASVVITLTSGFTWLLLLIHFLVIYIAELGIDMGLLKPLIKELIPFIGDALGKRKVEKEEN